MLNLYLGVEKEYSDLNLDMDMEFRFLQISLDFNAVEDRLVNLIDKGHLISNDQMHFIDRFGSKLPLICLSTGCKSALCVLHIKQGVVVDLGECGHNAQTIILTELKSGEVYIPFYDMAFYRELDFNDIIDVGLDGYRFTSLERFNYYLTDERPFKPDMSMTGIELI